MEGFDKVKVTINSEPMNKYRWSFFPPKIVEKLANLINQHLDLSVSTYQLFL
jgi:hypothetical protein